MAPVVETREVLKLRQLGCGPGAPLRCRARTAGRAAVIWQLLQRPASSRRRVSITEELLGDLLLGCSWAPWLCACSGSVWLWRATVATRLPKWSSTMPHRAMLAGPLCPGGTLPRCLTGPDQLGPGWAAWGWGSGPFVSWPGRASGPQPGSAATWTCTSVGTIRRRLHEVSA